MKGSIHQPNFIPYLGFFNKFKNSDIFVLYDTAQYSKNDYHNRNSIKTSNGVAWLTIPVSVKLGDSIKDVLIADQSFRKRHLRSIELNYKRAIFFDQIFPDVVKLYEGTEASLLDFNIKFLKYFFDIIDSQKKIVLTSQINISSDIKSTAALIEILNKIAADSYISGAGARNYLDEKMFESSGIKLYWQDFHHPIYEQLWGDFLPNMSVLDALFNVGPNKLKELL
ncbi:MAG: WbqC-like protein family protein [Parcubacteria group bacterium ADurb.Bin326]|nr:MAG: WbqC-like protein family protein [Parcubacteria group bacterium ADurb.Bin326]